MKNSLKNTLLISSIAIALTACGMKTTNDNSQQNQATSAQNNTTKTQKTSKIAKQNSRAYTSFLKFDIPMPSDSQLDLDHTLIIGNANNWIGRLSLEAPFEMSKMFDFYQKNMASFGWKSISTMRAESSVLTYQYNKRIATIMLTPGAMGTSTKVQFTVSPENKPINSLK